MEQSQNIGIILITGIPGSGKTYFSQRLKKRLQEDKIKIILISIDKIQAFLIQNTQIKDQEIINLSKNEQFLQKINKYRLNKQKFHPEIWKRSRKIVQNFQFLQFQLLNCDILIIEDQMPLKSQRKPFKQFCYEKDLKYLQIQMKAQLQEALYNNKIRGQQNASQMISQQVILKSISKFQYNEKSLHIRMQDSYKQLSNIDWIQRMQKVIIEDNYSKYLEKQSIKHVTTQKQLDQNDLRKLISRIMKGEQEFTSLLSNNIKGKQKSDILAECKKTYIQNKRKIPFIEIVNNHLLSRVELKQ